MGSRSRPAHFPPDPGPWTAPTGRTPGYIIGENAVAGFGCRPFFVAAIPAAHARDIIRRNHYSRRSVNNSYVHLGVFMNGRCVGAIQLGYMLNPARGSRVVEGTGNRQYLELNRMWLADSAPRNSESRALSYALKYIRRVLPRIRWIQSFADERCGGWGVVYQASGFRYLGCHTTAFWELDGEAYHDMLRTAHRKGGQRGRYLRANLHRAQRHRYRQFRYWRPLHPRCAKYLRFPILPYPKPSARPVVATKAVPRP